MKHANPTGGEDRHPHPPGRRGGPAGTPGRRPFDYGDLRLLVLDMIAERPSHGYELMRAIGDRVGGGYSPSPGVIYPTLSWLEDMGYATPETEAGRKSFGITPAGATFLDANRAALSEIVARLRPPGPPREAPEPILRAMHDLKHALRARFAAGPIDTTSVAAITAAISAAAGTVETLMTETPLTASLVRATAEVRTPKAAAYLAQLCKHFAHKIPTSLDGDTGKITFPSGECHLAARDEVLTMTVETSDPAAIPTLQDVVARHLLRFAFREDLAIEWQAA